jgi:hypothetical protein
MRRATALANPAAPGATSRTRSTVVATAACGGIRVCSTWYAHSRSASRAGGSILSTGRPAASAMTASSWPRRRSVP